MLGILFLLLLAACLTMARKLHSTILVPWCLYCTSWIGMFGLYSLGWIEYNPIRLSTWAVLAGACLAYVGGSACMLAPAMTKSPPRLPPRSMWFANVNLKRYDFFYLFLVALALIGAAGYFYVIERLFGVSILWTNPGLLRGLQAQDDYIQEFFWWKFAFYANWPAFALGVARMLLPKRRTPWWIKLSTVALLLLNLTLVSRSHMLILLFPIAVLTSAAAGRRRGSSEMAVIGGVLGVVAVYFVVMGQILGKTYEYSIYLASEFYGPALFRPLTGVYIYVTANIPAFQWLIDSPVSHTYGAFQALPLVKLLHGIGVPLDVPAETGQFALVPFPFNTYTYLNVFLQDWGLAGAIVGPFAYGALSHWLYVKVCRHGDIWHLIGLGYVCYAILSTIGGNVLVSTPEWEFAIILCTGYLWCRKASADVRASARFDQHMARSDWIPARTRYERDALRRVPEVARQYDR